MWIISTLMCKLGEYKYNINTDVEHKLQYPEILNQEYEVTLIAIYMF